MDTNYILTLLRQHSRAIIKPLLIEAIKECVLDGTFQNDSSGDDRIVSTAEAQKLLGVKDRHSVYQFIKEGLHYVDEKPYRFKVKDIKDFNELHRRSKLPSQ